MLLTCIRKALGLNLEYGASAIVPDSLRVVTQSFQVDARILPQFGNDCFLSNPFQLINLSSYHTHKKDYALYNIYKLI
jgi:hypothetical protein